MATPASAAAVVVVAVGPSLPTQLLLAGAANMCGAAATNPLDVVKVRLQLNPHAYPGWLRGLLRIAEAEGLRGLYRGLAPSLLREGSYSALRLGLYGPLKDAAMRSRGGGADAVPPLAVKLCAGAISGVIGCALASPTDLIKIRLQAVSEGAAATPPRRGMLATAASVIAREGGVAALWQGVGANVQRAALLTAVQVGTYDEIKGRLRRAAQAAAAVAADRGRLDQQVLTGSGALLLRHQVVGAAGVAASSPVDTAAFIARPTICAAVSSSDDDRTHHAPKLTPLFPAAAVAGSGGEAPPALSLLPPSAAMLAMGDSLWAAPAQLLAREGPPLHFAAASMAGLLTALVTTPVDTAKSRLMHQGALTVNSSSSAELSSVRPVVEPADAKGGTHMPGAGGRITTGTSSTTVASSAPPPPSPRTHHDRYHDTLHHDRYQGTLHCISCVWRAEGVRGVYAGFLPTWGRLAVHTVVTFTVYEELRRWVGMTPV